MAVNFYLEHAITKFCYSQEQVTLLEVELNLNCTVILF